MAVNVGSVKYNLDGVRESAVLNNLKLEYKIKDKEETHIRQCKFGHFRVVEKV